MPTRSVSFTTAGAATAGGVLVYTMLFAGVTTAAAAATALWLAYCAVQCALEAPAPGEERCRFPPQRFAGTPIPTEHGEGVREGPKGSQDEERDGEIGRRRRRPGGEGGGGGCEVGR
jgi:hypothetical protein